MNITVAQYMQNTLEKINISIKATIDGQEMYVPLDPANRHFQAIQEWIAKGNKIKESD